MTRFMLALAAALALATPALAKPSADDLRRISEMETRLAPLAGPTRVLALTERMAELKVPGVSVAFIEDGKVKWARTYGVAVAGGRPVTPETLFQAASMSKALAATATLRLVEQGRLGLDEDVNSRLKSWKVPASPYTVEQKVTLRRLLSHTAGMTVGGFPGYAVGQPVPTTVQILDGQPPANTPAIRSFEAPGGQYAYSGGGYTVAQLAIVEAGGKPYPELLQELVLTPAGMRQSSYAQPLPAAKPSACGHDRKGDVIPGCRHTYPEYAAASLWTTPSDYGRFMIALQDSYAGRPHALLRQASAQAMMTPVDAGAGYGLGVALGKRGGHPFFQHGGSNAGFQCNAVAFLDGSRQGVVVMTNGDAGGQLAAEITRAVAAAYAWGDPDPANKASPRRAPFVPPAPK
jgi:CubicO group peptidase (beta-lactamase class C family)